jgi:outer membrane receptor protein involved in Fe transport
MVDGVPMTNPFGGGSTIGIENQGIQELQVISGTFNAEYGQAQSGIINIVTKEGHAEYHGTISGYLGSHVSNRSNLFMNIDNLSPTNLRDIRGTFTGALPLTNKKVTFFTSFRYAGSEGHLYGQRRIRLEDTQPIRVFEVQVDRGEIVYQRTEQTGALNIPDSLKTGDGAYVPMNPSDSYSFQGRLSYHLLPNMKLSYSLFRNYSTGKNYDNAHRYAPDGVAPYWSWGFAHILSMTHTLSSKSFYTVNFSSYSSKSESHLYDDPLDLRYEVAAVNSGGFNFGGTQHHHTFGKNSSLLAKMDFTSQVDHFNLVKAGLEIKQHDLSSYGYSPIIRDTYDAEAGRFIITERYVPDVDNIARRAYHYKPVEAAFYAQDKLEYKEIILNAGLRLDYLDSHGEIPVDLRAIVNQGRLMSSFKPASKKYQLSPRLGLAFPISERGVIHLAYGHFFQIPPFGYLYENSTYAIGLGQIGGVVGNADLDPERTIAYELGLQQQLAENTGLSVTLYYKNIKNLLGMELVSTANYRVYARYINRDYGNVRGIIVALDQRRFGPFSATMDYTYQVARGNSSDPRQVLYDNQTDPPRESEKQVLPLDWDQIHTLNGTLTLSEPGKWGASLIGRFGTGQPYTPTNPGSALSAQFRNSARKPNHAEVDFTAHKDFKIGGFSVSAFATVFNLFDAANHLAVYSSTGRADREYRTPGQALAERENLNFTLEERDRHPEWYSAPRRVLVGVDFGF